VRQGRNRFRPNIGGQNRPSEIPLFAQVAQEDALKFGKKSDYFFLAFSYHSGYNEKKRFLELRQKRFAGQKTLSFLFFHTEVEI